MATQIHLIVTGYIHPLEGGDDEFFSRGFHIKKDTMEGFKKFFKKDYEKKSYPLDDYHIEEVTKKEWLKEFNY